MLPTRLRGRIYSLMLRQLHNKKLDRTNVHAVQAKFTAILKEQIELFDREIGETLQQICPAPENLTEEQARHLVEHHKEAIDCAFEGTTLALALVNVDQRFMWAAGVGDSTVGELMWRQPESSSLTVAPQHCLRSVQTVNGGPSDYATYILSRIRRSTTGQ